MTPLDLARAGAVNGPEHAAVLAILERAIAWQELASVESQFQAAATCALTCAGLLGLGFAVIAVKTIRDRRKRRARA
jgi:hypothetical protein